MSDQITANLKYLIAEFSDSLRSYVFGGDSQSLQALWIKIATEIQNNAGNLDPQESVLSKNLVTSPASPVAGARYIIAGTGGAWSGFTINDIVEYDGSFWFNVHPTKGMVAYNEADSVSYLYSGAAWVNFASSLSHSSLTDLGNDDHAQYLIRSGIRNMTGALGTDVGTFSSAVADGAAAKAFTFTSLALTTSGAKLLSLKNAASEKLSVSKDGDVICNSVNPSNLPVYDVSKYGLVPDYAGLPGSTDNSAAFVALLNSIPARTPCIVFFPSVPPNSDYRFGTAMTVDLTDKIITFKGNIMDGSGTWLYFDDASGYGIKFNSTGGSGVHELKFEDIYFYCKNYAPAVANSAIIDVINGRATFRRCTFGLNNATGVNCFLRLNQAIQSVVIEDCVFQGATPAGGALLWMFRSNAVYARNLAVSYNPTAGDAIRIDYLAANIVIDKLSITGTGSGQGYGVRMLGDATNVSLRDIYYFALGNGIYIDGGCSNIVIDNPIFVSRTAFDIYVADMPYNVSVRNYSSNSGGFSAINSVANITLIGGKQEQPSVFPFVRGIANRDANIVSGLSGQRAIGTLTFTDNNAIGETITVAGQVHTIIASTAVPPAVLAPNTIKGGSGSGAGGATSAAGRVATYFNLNSSVNGLVYAVAAAPARVLFYAKAQGVAANSYTFSTTCANGTCDGGGFLGGTSLGVDPVNNFTVDYLTGNVTAGTINGVDVATLSYEATKRIHIQKSYNDFKIAGFTNSATILILPAGAKIVDVYANVTAAFVGGTIATYTISVGTTGTEYMLANDVHSAPVALVAAGAKGTNLTTPGKSNVESFIAGTVINAYAVSTVDTLDHATAGLIDFYIEYVGA